MSKDKSDDPDVEAALGCLIIVVVLTALAFAWVCIAALGKWAGLW